VELPFLWPCGNYFTVEMSLRMTLCRNEEYHRQSVLVFESSCSLWISNGALIEALSNFILGESVNIKVMLLTTFAACQGMVYAGSSKS